MRVDLLTFVSALSIVLLVQTSQFFAQKPQRDNRPHTASIGGRVTIGGKAAANAKIAVTEVKDNTVRGNQDVPDAPGGSGAGEDYVALTDADGRYRVTGLPEGKYKVEALLESCVREQPSANESLTESVSLDEGESRENIDFSLVRGGVITGRVTGADGRPLIAKTVKLQIVDEQGRKKEAGDIMFEMFQTDDRGIYRIYALRPGRYLVSAGGDGDSGFLGLLTGDSGNYPRAWYPDATNENQAKVIEVAAGGEITDIDIKLGAAKKTYEAVGRVIDDETGNPIAAAGVVCVKGSDDGGAFNSIFGMFGGVAKTDGQGIFHLNGLAPGQYQLSLTDYESFLTGGGSGYYSNGTRFEIQSSDVAGVEIRAKRGATISGVAVIEDADPSAKSSLSQTMIMAHSSPVSTPSSLNEIVVDASALGIGNTPVGSRIGSDGSFSLKGLRPGKVMIQVFSITGGGLQVMRIEHGGVDVSEGIVVGAGRDEINGVRIVIGKGAGVIRGQVQVAGGALPEGWGMRVSARNEKKAGITGDYSGSAVVDGKGRFVIEGLFPGEYQLTLMAQPEINSNLAPPPAGNMPAPVTQKVIVTKGQEAEIRMTLDLSKKGQ